MAGNLGGKSISIEYYEAQFVINLIQDIVVFVCIPTACIIGLILNIDVVRTLKKYAKSDLKENFYKFMSANSIFNSLYLLDFRILSNQHLQPVRE
jgi:hypothetical protein